MISSRTICVALAILAFACLVYAQDATPGASDAVPNPNCPVQRTKAFINNMMDSIRSMTGGSSTAGSPTLSRRRRQVDSGDVTPTSPSVPEPTQQDVIAYNQSLQKQEGALYSTLVSIMSSQYMPSREQVIQLLTTVLTLLLMMALGPVMGQNASMVQAIVRQIVPFLVTAGVHYAADTALPEKEDITSVQLAPVQAQPSVSSSI